MTAREAAEKYRTLPPIDQLRVLARYAHWLTLVARGTYIPGTDGVADPRRLRALNEVQHRVVGFIAAIADGKRPWCDDVVVVRIAIDEDDPVLLGAFSQALQECK